VASEKAAIAVIAHWPSPLYRFGGRRRSAGQTPENGAVAISWNAAGVTNVVERGDLRRAVRRDRLGDGDELRGRRRRQRDHTLIVSHARPRLRRVTAAAAC
jgi:hypothetical protein